MRWHRYKRPALATITTSLILLAAIAALGVSGIVLYQSKIKGVKEDISSSYTSVANKVQESLFVENTYFHNTTQSMNITLTNNGNIPVQITNATLKVGPLFASANATVVSAGTGGISGTGFVPATIALDASPTNPPAWCNGCKGVTISNFNADPSGTGTNKLLVITVHYWTNPGATTMKVNGVSLPSSVIRYSDSGSSAYEEVWVLANPPTGTFSIVQSSFSSVQTAMSAWSYTGVDQASPVAQTHTNSNTNNSTASNVIITTYQNSAVFDVLTNHGSSEAKTSPPSAVIAYDDNQDLTSMDTSASYVPPTAGNAGTPYTFHWTLSGNTIWSDTAVELKAATISGVVVAGSYIPITITNNQNSATPTTFQEEITFNPSLYTYAEGSDLGNIMFCEDTPVNGVCNTEDYAWLENCDTSPCTNTSISATVWIKLNGAIQGNGGTRTINMLFQSPTTIDFTDNHWGESYQAATNSFSHDNIANVMNNGLITQIYYHSSTCDDTSYQSSLYDASLDNGATISQCTSFAPYQNQNPYFTAGSGSNNTSVNGVNKNNVLINYQTGYSGGGAWPSAYVPDTSKSWLTKAEGWALVTSSTTMRLILDDNGAMSSSTTQSGFATGGADWLGASEPSTPISNAWKLQSGISYSGSISTGDNRIETDFAENGGNTYFGMWSDAHLRYYSFTEPPNGVMPTTSLGSTQSSSSSFKTLTQNGKCIIYPGQSCTESITYHCFSDPVSVTVTTARGRTFQTDVAPVVPWYSSQWQYRKEITIINSQVGGMLTNFPVLVNITDSNLKSNAQSSGNDIVFTSCDGKTPLKYEIEKYTSSTGSLVAWVNVPAIYDTPNDIIYMYYGNPNANSLHPLSYVPVTLTNSQSSSASSLSVDGSNKNQFSGTNSGTVSLTTTNANDVIVVLVANENRPSSVLRTVSTITAPGLTFVQRSSGTVSSYVDTEVWYAIAASSFSSTITVTLSGSTDDASIVAFAVSGANTDNPWDTNAALPAVNTNSGSGTPSVSGVSTNNANDMILGFEGAGPTSSPANENSAAGYTLIQTQKNTGGTDYSQATAEYNVVSVQQSGISVALSTSTPAWIMIGDAIVADTPTTSMSTPVPFQQQITFNPSQYTSLEAANLGNIRFCADPNCNTPLNAWLENCSPSCTNAATSATVWVELNSAISPDGGTQTIYMTFQPASTNFDGNIWGEAPQITGTYGQYDNGANVFNQYGGGGAQGWSSFNFNGGTWSTSNGYLQQTDANTGSYQGGPAALILTNYTNTGSYILDEAFSYTTQSNARVGIVAVATRIGGGDVEGYRFIGQQFSDGAGFLSFLNDQGSGGACNGGWVVCNTYGGSINTQYTMSVADNAGIWNGTLYSGYGTAGDELAWLYGTSYSIANKQGQNSGYVGISAAYHPVASNTVSNPINVQWFRMRALPPNNVMPAVSFGSTGQVDPWDSNYIAVWHLKENPSQTLQIIDSTGNGDHLTASSASITQVDGRIDGSLNFASSRYLSNTSPLVKPPSTGVMTGSAWFLASSTSGTQDILKIGNSVKMGYVSPNFAVTSTGGTTLVSVAASSVPSGAWHYVVYTYDGATNRLYIDGAQVATSSTSPATGSPSNLYVAIKDGSLVEPFTGQIDEIRISNIARSVAWILTEYNNQAFSSSFYKIGTQQAYSDPRTSS